MSTVTGNIFDIQRFSLHDGPGIRTTIFMQGCPLRCMWCHNPESISAAPQLSFIPDTCIGCGKCFEKCSENAHAMINEQHLINREVCTVCGKCADECYAKALEIVGRSVSTDEVMKEVLADKLFYENSGGGMTLSGGEPTMQLEFSLELLRNAKAEGIHTAVETCGLCKYDNLEQMAKYTDLFLCDFKESDPEKHKEFTGASNEVIIDNITKLSKAGKIVRLRCPIIPTLNDRDEHLLAIAKLYKSLPNCEGVELMPYHGLGEGKLYRFGENMPGGGKYANPEPENIKEWTKKLAEYGANVL